MVGGDHQARGVRHPARAHLGQPGVGRGQHRGDPLPGRVQRGPPGPGGVLLRQRLAQPHRVLLAGPGPPSGLARVRQEDHRTHHAVPQRLAVPVGVVGPGPQQAVGAALVADERDRVVVGAERGAGQRQPPHRRGERLAHRVAPGQRIPGVVHLVQDHQGAPVVGARPVQHRVGGHLRVGDRHAAEVAGDRAGAVAERRVQRDAVALRRGGPLRLQVLGGGDDGDRLHGVVGDQFGRHPQRERGLAGARGGHREEVGRAAGQVAGERAPLPHPQRRYGGGLGWRRTHAPSSQAKRPRGRGRRLARQPSGQRRRSARPPVAITAGRRQRSEPWPRRLIRRIERDT